MKTTKQVQILATYYHKTNGKLNGTVSYLVRSSNGQETYCTTVVDGKASGCSCPAKSRCYHKTQLENKEQARKFAAKSLPVWAVELVKSGKLVAPGKTPVAKVPVAKVIEQAVAAKVPTPKTDISTKGNLNGQRGFSLMR